MDFGWFDQEDAAVEQDETGLLVCFEIWGWRLTRSGSRKIGMQIAARLALI